MRLINLDNYNNPKLKKMMNNDGYETYSNGYVFVDKKEILGYVLLKKNMIDWIHAKPGYGTELLKRVERILFKKYSKIILKLSIDPTELKSTVLRRINFYIKNKYRVSDIKFRKKYGPIMTMFKKK